MTRDETWRCALCGQEHPGLATVFGPATPDLWMRASDEERANGEINADMCFIPLVDGSTHYFLRGHLQIPVLDPGVDWFTWSVWVSLSDQSMATAVEHWNDPDRATLPPMFGWLSNVLPYDESTIALPAEVHTRELGLVPLIQLDESVEHPLIRDQLHGITLHRVAELNEDLLRRPD